MFLLDTLHRVIDSREVFHTFLCFFRFSALSIESLEERHKDIKRRFWSVMTSSRALTGVNHTWARNYNQIGAVVTVNVENTCFCLETNRERDAALLTATHVIFITERMKEIWKKLGS